MAMAMSTSAATGHTSLASAAQPQVQGQEGSNLRSSHHCLPSLFKCRGAGALSASISRASFRLRPNSVFPVRAVATVKESTENASTAKATKYHFLVANAKFMLDDEEHFQELMRERLRNFGERNREQDFWLVIEPKFLDKFPDICKRLKRPAVALVSTDELWITFMKLRLDRVLRGEIESETLTEALQSNPAELNFEKPQTWTAPYAKYGGDWWTPFLPPGDN